MQDEQELITIGQLARRTGLTTKALRHYDRVGLLTPAAVDDATGYRFYAPDQVAQARLVQLLRSVDMPLEQVRECLAAPDDEERIRQVLAPHRRRLQARLDRVRGDLHRIDHLLRDGVFTTMTDTATTSTTATGPESPSATATERQQAIDLFNGVWRLIEKENRGVEDDDAMLHMAHASRHHWGQAGTAANLARGEWQVSRVYTVLERGEPALYHAQRMLDICRANGIGDWDLAFAYEALARASAVAGDKEQARAWTEQALAAAEDIVEDGDRELVMTDLESIPGQPRFW